MTNQANYCRDRGYHGPFTGTEKYERAGGLWVGQGECVRCQSTVHIPTELAARARLTAADCAPVIREAA